MGSLHRRKNAKHSILMAHTAVPIRKVC
ncbi:hypothetical protein Bhyg_17796 [Pseudolycoriella hygida]|uniref:Uncharacterized protein n=1 Tax=Pseudolycoriella hygida TaxID=35572 RepID=A0A9Q0RW25_9DIPT|nr:hypothetical protein Bhyg_17796 [Pseudolycoriella hygida]